MFVGVFDLLGNSSDAFSLERPFPVTRWNIAAATVTQRNASLSSPTNLAI
jgi:hypothetical protein